MVPLKNLPVGSALFLSLLLAGCGAVFVNKGSKQEPLTAGLRDPSAVQIKVIVPADQKVVGNFDDGSTKMSPKLFGSNSGTWNAFTYGGNTINNPFVLAGGANGTPMAVHIFGTLNNKGDGTYPAFTVQGKLKESGYFDATPFTGIRFYYKCPGSDKAPARRFAITIAPTLPTSNGGTCVDQCYNHFGADLSMGDWSRVSYAFSDLKRQSGWGSAVLPPELNEHLKEFVGFEWAHNAGNAAGSYAIDYWLDEVEFF